MKNVKFKIIVSFVFGVLFFSGCVRNVDLRQQAKDEKAQEQKSISSMKKDFGHPMSKIEEQVKILFVGDMMFDRHIREAVGKYGSGDYSYVLEPLKVKLSEYDLVAGNLEGPITENESTSVNTKIGESKNFVFTFDQAVAKTLFENNIKLVNLGNNHILNQGAKGIEQTKQFLSDAGVEYFGDTGSGNGSFIEKEINGIKLVFVSYNYAAPDSELSSGKLPELSSDIVIVLPHWGTEYKVGDPGETVRVLARRFIDAGADAVIGTHPHVVQINEEYKGKKIYYSLGNFVFDQYFQKETMEGLGVGMTINSDHTMEFGELKFEMTTRGQVKQR
jgi:poly-gamma-glutamate capsule biosynthesis protein CapA/YwtB (metallophosphatase superfamily)